MTTYISEIIIARAIKYGINMYCVSTQITFILEFDHAPSRTRKSIKILLQV